MKSIILVNALLLVISALIVPGVNLAHAEQSKAPDIKEYGTDPARYFVPKTAIDTTDVPNIVLKSSAKDTDLLPYYKIAPGTYLFFGNIAQIDQFNRGWNGNAGFVVTSEGVVVIDSLGTPRLGRRMIATIRSITDKPIKYLIITHNHPDHSYGAIAFRDLGGVKVISHAGALDYINSNKIDNSVDFRRSIIKQDMTGFAAVAPDIPITGKLYSSYKLKLGNKTFEIYNTGKHHSYGDLVVFQANEKIVWISDLAFNQRTTFMGDGNSRQAIKAQEWLLTKFSGTKLMVPGHGSAQTAPFPMVRKTRDYMKRLRSTLNQAMANDLDLLEAVDQADFKDWRNIRLYGLNQRANANFVYRELEQENF